MHRLVAAARSFVDRTAAAGCAVAEQAVMGKVRNMLDALLKGFLTYRRDAVRFEGSGMVIEQARLQARELNRKLGKAGAPISLREGGTGRIELAWRDGCVALAAHNIHLEIDAAPPTVEAARCLPSAEQGPTWGAAPRSGGRQRPVQGGSDSDSEGSTMSQDSPLADAASRDEAAPFLLRKIILGARMELSVISVRIHLGVGLWLRLDIPMLKVHTRVDPDVPTGLCADFRLPDGATLQLGSGGDSPSWEPILAVPPGDTVITGHLAPTEEEGGGKPLAGLSCLIGELLARVDLEQVKALARAGYMLRELVERLPAVEQPPPEPLFVNLNLRRAVARCGPSATRPGGELWEQLGGEGGLCATFGDEARPCAALRWRQGVGIAARLEPQGGAFSSAAAQAAGGFEGNGELTLGGARLEADPDMIGELLRCYREAARIAQRAPAVLVTGRADTLVDPTELTKVDPSWFSCAETTMADPCQRVADLPAPAKCVRPAPPFPKSLTVSTAGAVCAAVRGRGGHSVELSVEMEAVWRSGGCAAGDGVTAEVRSAVLRLHGPGAGGDAQECGTSAAELEVRGLRVGRPAQRPLWQDVAAAKYALWDKLKGGSELLWQEAVRTAHSSLTRGAVSIDCSCVSVRITHCPTVAAAPAAFALPPAEPAAEGPAEHAADPGGAQCQYITVSAPVAVEIHGDAGAKLSLRTHLRAVAATLPEGLCLALDLPGASADFALDGQVTEQLLYRPRHTQEPPAPFWALRQQQAGAPLRDDRRGALLQAAFLQPARLDAADIWAAVDHAVLLLPSNAALSALAPALGPPGAPPAAAAGDAPAAPAGGRPAPRVYLRATDVAAGVALPQQQQQLGLHPAEPPPCRHLAVTLRSATVYAGVPLSEPAPRPSYKLTGELRELALLLGPLGAPSVWHLQQQRSAEAWAGQEASLGLHRLGEGDRVLRCGGGAVAVGSWALQAGEEGAVVEVRGSGAGGAQRVVLTNGAGQRSPLLDGRMYCLADGRHRGYKRIAQLAPQLREYCLPLEELSVSGFPGGGGVQLRCDASGAAYVAYVSKDSAAFRRGLHEGLRLLSVEVGDRCAERFKDDADLQRSLRDAPTGTAACTVSGDHPLSVEARVGGPPGTEVSVTGALLRVELDRELLAGLLALPQALGQDAGAAGPAPAPPSPPSPPRPSRAPAEGLAGAGLPVAPHGAPLSGAEAGARLSACTNQVIVTPLGSCPGPAVRIALREGLLRISGGALERPGPLRQLHFEVPTPDGLQRVTAAVDGMADPVHFCLPSHRAHALARDIRRLAERAAPPVPCTSPSAPSESDRGGPDVERKTAPAGGGWSTGCWTVSARALQLVSGAVQSISSFTSATAEAPCHLPGEVDKTWDAALAAHPAAQRLKLEGGLQVRIWDEAAYVDAQAHKQGDPRSGFAVSLVHSPAPPAAAQPLSGLLLRVDHLAIDRFGATGEHLKEVFRPDIAAGSEAKALTVLCLRCAAPKCAPTLRLDPHEWVLMLDIAPVLLREDAEGINRALQFITRKVAAGREPATPLRTPSTPGGCAAGPGAEAAAGGAPGPGLFFRCFRCSNVAVQTEVRGAGEEAIAAVAGPWSQGMIGQTLSRLVHTQGALFTVPHKTLCGGVGHLGRVYEKQVRRLLAYWAWSYFKGFARVVGGSALDLVMTPLRRGTAAD